MIALCAHRLVILAAISFGLRVAAGGSVPAETGGDKQRHAQPRHPVAGT